MEEERRQDEDRSAVQAKIEGLTSKDLLCEDGLGVKLHIRPGLQEYLKELNEVAPRPKHFPKCLVSRVMHANTCGQKPIIH